MNSNLPIILSESAFKNRMLTITVQNNDFKDPKRFLEKIMLQFPDILAKVSIFPCKIHATLIGKFIMPKSDISDVKYINTRNKLYLDSDNSQEWYKAHILEKILKNLAEFSERGSGWSLEEIIALEIKINKCSLFSTGGATFVDLPKEIENKKACINLRTFDNFCFAWALGCSFQNVKKNVSRVSSYRHYSNFLNLEGISFPFSIKQLNKVEQLNNMTINIFGLKHRNVKDSWCLGKNIEEAMLYEDDEQVDDVNNQKSSKEKKCRKKHIDRKDKYEVLPIRITNDIKEKHVNLLLIQQASEIGTFDENNTTYHFVYIKDLSRLVNTQTSRGKCKLVVCDRCLCLFRSQEKLDFHKIDCIKFKGVKSVLPQEKNKMIKFRNFKHKEKVPFIIYYDLETYLAPIDSASPDPSVSYTCAYEKHIVYSLGYYLQCSFDNNLSFYKFKRGSDCIDWFLQELKSISEHVIDMYNSVCEMIALTVEEQNTFENSQTCHICGKNFTVSDVKIRDHNHLTGHFRGASHQSCNLAYQLPNFIPVVSHNMNGYDSHFFIQQLCTKLDGDLTLLPFNKEKYKSFTKKITVNITEEETNEGEHSSQYKSINLRFIDSFNFMPFSLAKLSSYLAKFNTTEREYNNLSQEKVKLLLKKGVFPYNYVTSMDLLNECCLPSKDTFFNKLIQEHITDKDYSHAQNIWKTFSCRTLGDYSDLYLKTDVLLLCDVFESFRELCLKNYKLDAAYYITAPSLGWDAMLKISAVELELLTDIDMLLMIEGGVRGGLSNCVHRHAKADNKFLNNKNNNCFLAYFDVNNLYGYAMSNYLPQSHFKFLTENEMNDLKIADIKSDSSVGYIFEVDLEYPREFHDDHSDLPFCPEKKVPPNGKYKKLLATLEPKTKYVIHYRNLQQCLQHGMKITKIHRVLRFFQAPWMLAYINLNTQMRALAKNDFETEFYKLMNNAVFGKTMQNVRKMRDVKLVSKYAGAYGADYYMSKPNFYDRIIFDENCVAIEMKRCKIFFNKPIIVGFSVLDISKTQVYKFHYDFMKQKYSRENLQLCYTDTDSLIYRIKTHDLYADLKSDLREWFDTSAYPVDNAYGYPLVNKKVIGLLKDELNGQIFEEFVGLRSKMYSLKVYKKDEDICKAKGLAKSVKRTLSLEDYRECLLSGEPLKKKQNLIRSQKHNVYTVEQNKTALDLHDDKRHICSDGISTLALGHYSLSEVHD